MTEIKTKVVSRKALDGKTYTFKVDLPYHTEECHDAEEIFKGSACKYAVLYTEIKEDKGERLTSWFGMPKWEKYDNGLVGYQQGQLFDTYDEMMHDYKLRKRLVPKVGTVAYCDVFCVEYRD